MNSIPKSSRASSIELQDTILNMEQWRLYVIKVYIDFNWLSGSGLRRRSRPRDWLSLPEGHALKW